MDAWQRMRTSGPVIGSLLTTALGLFLLLSLLLSWITVSGTSALASAGWCLAATAGFSLSAILSHRLPRTILCVVVAAGAAMMSVLTATTAFDVCLTWAISSGLPPFGVWPLAALPTLAGSAISGFLFQLSTSSASRSCLAGLMLGAAVFAAHTWLAQPFVLTAGILAAATIAFTWLTTRAEITRHSSVPTSPARVLSLAVLTQVAAGAGLVAGGLILHRVFSVTPVTLTSALLLTTSVLWLTQLPVLRMTRHPQMLWIGCLAVLALLPWSYSSVLQWNLHFRASATSGLSVVLFQALQLAAWFCPVLLAAAAGRGVIRTEQQSESGLMIPALAAGATLAWILTAADVSPHGLALISLTALVGPPALFLWQVPAVSRPFRTLRLIGSTASGLVVMSLAVCPPDLAAPAHLLFTPRSFVAIQRGIRPEMIPETDATRLVDSQETADGTVTTWKTQADHYEFRINGHQVGEVSTNVRTTPQPPAEVLSCVLPLVLHNHPGSVLLLDDFSGAAVNVCEQFPLHRIVSVESRQTAAARKLLARPQTSQIESRTSQAEIAVRDNALAPVDVVICVLTDPSRAAALSRLSTSWFQSVARRLNADGVFCQRIRQQSIDREILVQLLGRASSAFEQVALVQLVPGELAILASSSESPMLDQGTLNRMERPHVRRQLARCGWDWCQLAALSVVDSTDPVGLWQHETFPAPTGTITGSTALRLGWQNVRPGYHSASISGLLIPHQRRIAEAVPSSPAHDEFRRRISAYAQQLEVLTAFPDQPWIYRKSLKSEMTRNQRPPVEVIEDGELKRHIHPLDQYRKDYVTAIGAVLQQIPAGTLSAGDLRRVSTFSVDYEPLISDFAHYELVQIHELAQHPMPTDEFQHRLHTVNYSQPGEYSVRNVIGALDQLTSQPEVVNSDIDRFDQLNALIQQLILRWESRTSFEPRSAVRTQRDVELSVQATQKALIEMERLADTTGVSREDFLIRRQFITEALIRPLRDYNDQVLAHRAKTEPMLSSDDTAGEEPDDEVLRMLINQPATN